jgi:hypothetical protein
VSPCNSVGVSAYNSYLGLASSLGFTSASSATVIEGFIFFLRIMSHATRPITPMPPMTDPTAIPALAPVLRETVDELVESPESESGSEVDEAGMEVEVPSAALRSRSVEEASIEVEVSSVAMVVERVAVVDVNDSTLDEQLPNMLWHLIKFGCQRHRDNGQIGFTRIY